MIRAGVLLGALLLSTGCAMTLAVGDPAHAAFRVPAATCPGAPLAGAPATKRTEIVAVDKKALGPDDTTTTTIVEPAPAQSVAVAESQGAKVSETGGGIIKTGLRFLGGIVAALLPAFLAP